jgi:predicted nuclease of restriction endonuclease-like (RecB) superfamily
MAKKLLQKIKRNISNNKRIDVLYQNIAGYIRVAHNNIMYSVNTEQVKAYWLIGRDIIEEEQKGTERAGYGAFLLQEISARLSKDFGQGFGLATVKDMRRFYSVYAPIRHALRGELVPVFKNNLSWIHYRALMREDRPAVRSFYELEAEKNCWSGRELERQMGSLLFERLLKSKNKKGLMQLAYKGQEIINPVDAIKEPVVLEFLNMPESHKLVESKLEDALISNMQNFLLELGRGFAFVGRQKRLTLDGKHFYCDLVFYHVILKVYVLIDIKTHELSHADLGQMQLYVNYFDMEVKTKSDNPTIGLILCTKQSKKMVKYFLGDRAKQIFASKYQFNLPTEKELEEELKRGIKDIKYRLEHKKGE